jgi:hypothetical protein
MCIHRKWSKWGTPYTGTQPLGDQDVPVVVQQRVCEKCGEIEIMCIWVGTLEGFTPQMRDSR